MTDHRTAEVLAQIREERDRQDARWGQQDHDNGTGRTCDQINAYNQRLACDKAFEQGSGTWSHILREEVAEALAESDPHLLRGELVQVAAVAAAWIEAIDRKGL